MRPRGSPGSALGGAEKEIFAAYWTEGRDIGRIDVLSELASSVGLDPEELKIALDIDKFSDEVLRDRELAQKLRVPGTPRFSSWEVVAPARSPALAGPKSAR